MEQALSLASHSRARTALTFLLLEQGVTLEQDLRQQLDASSSHPRICVLQAKPRPREEKAQEACCEQGHPSRKYILSRHITKTKRCHSVGPVLPDLLAGWEQTPLPLSVLHVCTQPQNHAERNPSSQVGSKKLFLHHAPKITRVKRVKPLTVRQTQPPAREK